MSLGLYLHIPYCFSKCRYCDFYSHPGERGVPDAYVDALLRELHRFAPNAPLRPDRKSTRLNSSHTQKSRMPSSA